MHLGTLTAKWKHGMIWSVAEVRTLPERWQRPRGKKLYLADFGPWELVKN